MRKRPSIPSARHAGFSALPIVALEKRIAFDGAAAATAAKAIHTLVVSDHAPHSGAGADAAREPVAHRDPLPEHAFTNADASSAASALRGLDLDAGALRATARPTTPKSVVFIESDVPDVATLIKDVDHSAQIVLLDPSKDGVDAIASYLATHKDVRDVYIFSHGSEGRLDLGTATLDSASMQGRYAGDLATIKGVLAPGANILVYGCDFAEGVAGDSAAHLLSQLTGAAVAASTNLTGGTAEGGDFVLEDHVGTIDAPDVLSGQIATDYVGLLAAAPTTIFANTGTGLYRSNIEFLTFANTTLATGGITNGATATYTTAAGSTVTVTFSNVSNATDDATFKPAALNAYSPSKFYGGYNNTASSSIMLYGVYKDTASFTVSFTATDKNGKSYTPNIAFADGEVTDASGENYTVTTNGGNFLNVETVGTNSYSLTGTGTQSITLANTGSGVPLLVTDNASSLNVSVQIAGGKQGFVLALVNPTLSLDKDASSGATTNNYQTTFTEKGSAVAIADTDTNAVEPGLTNASSATIVLTNAQAGDALSVGTLPSGITSSIDTSKAGQVTVTLSGASSLANYNSAIHAISFANSSSNPSTIDRTINVTYSDGSQLSNTAVSTVHVTAVNDAPVETVPGAQTTNKDTSLSISGLSVSDVDANGGTETVTLSVANGTISLASTTGLTFSKGTGTNDTTETFTGTLSAIDKAIGTVKYQPTTGYYGSDTLNFSTNDNGNTGSGGAMTASQTVGITVNNVNPTANGTISNQKYTDGQSGISIATSQAFSDSLGLTLTYSATGLPKGLTIDATTGKITGTVDHDASTNAPSKTGSGATLDGTYTVVETASDGQGGSTTQTFKIDSTNQAPVVGTKTTNQTNSDGDTITAVNAATAFSDPNGDPLTYTASNLPTGLSISSSGMITGTVSKTAATGPYTVTVTGTDDKGAATTETFTWQINDVLPTAGADTFSAAHNGSVAINVLGNDTDALGRQLTVTQVNGKTITAGGAAVSVANGSVKLNSDGTLTFTPTTGYVGSPSFTYTIADPVGGTTTANVTGVVTDARPIVDLNGPQTVTNTITNGTSLGSTGWSTTNGTQSKGGYYFDTDYGTSSISQANVSGLDHGAGAYGAAQLSFGFGWNNGTPDVKAATVNITVGGTVYAQITTGTPGSDPNIATITYLNGASGNVSAVTATAYQNWTPTQVTIDLPANVVSKGTVAFNVDSSGSTDDVFFNNVSTTTLPATTYGYATTYSEKGSAVAIAASSASVFDGDDANLASASVVLTNKLAGDQLAIAGTAVTNGSSGTYMGLAYTVSDASGAETVSFAGSATKAVYQQALEAITFANTNYAPSTTPRTLNVTVSDGISTSATAVTKITVVDQNPSANGALANKTYTDGQSPITIATAGGFADPSGSAFTYTVSGLPKGLSIDAATGQITGAIDHDASMNAPKTAGSGATLDGTYSVSVTATDTAGRVVTQTFTIDSTNQAPTVGTKTADQTNKDGDTVTAIDASKAFSDSNGDPLTYAATGLPAGLSISSAGMITGTVAGNAAPGAYSVTVTATDDKGAVTPETFTWTIVDVPPTTSGTLANKSYSDGQSGIAIATSQGFTPTNGNALTYSATGLPAGLSIDATSGKITGTIDHDASKNAPTTTGSGATLDGTYAVVVTASDGLGGTAKQSFTIDSANGAPTVGTATGAQSGTTGQAVTAVDTSKAFSDPNGDPLTYSASNLPKGLSIDPATGIITGTVAANAAPGSYAVRVLATDDKGAATREAFTWTITDTPPTATGTLANKTYADATANIAIATSGAFTSPNGLALSYTASGLPKGLSIDPSTGTITGQLDHDASKTAPKTSGAGATLDGTYTVVVTASDGQGGTAQQVFEIDATNNAPTLVAQTPDQTGANGQKVSLDGAKPFNDQNTGDIFTYAATGLPTGLTIDPNTGLVSGTIDPHASRNGPFTVTVTITDDKGAATSESFQWGVNDVAPVATPVLPDRSVNDGSAVSVTTAGGFTNPNNVAYTYTASGLPKGLTIDLNTGIISGTIDHDASAGGTGGSYTIAVTANDGQGGTATNGFHLVSSNQAPVVGTKTIDQTSAEGATVAGVDASKAFSDPNAGDIVTYTASNLPPGLTIDPKTGIISGTVPGNATPGAYYVTVTATDDKGAATAETFDWSIDNVPPVATGTLANRTFEDSTAGISIATAGGFTDAVNNTLLYSATGLPAGLAIDQKTGQITGTLDHDASADGVESGSGATLDGKYTIVVTARDSLGGSATQTFTIDAKNDAPVTGTTTPVQTDTEGDAVSVNTAIAFSDPNLGDVLTYSATMLPPGLAIDPKSGLISGTVASGDFPNSPYQVVVTATDEKGASAQETFSFVTLPPPVMAVSVIPNYSGFDGTTASIDTASHFAGSADATTVYTVSGLPSGLSIDATSGRITGTLDHDASKSGVTETGSGATLDGQYNVTVTATNAGGAASQTFVLDVANQAPVVGTKTVDQTATTGQTIATLDASRAFSDPNGDPLTYAATGLPTGLSIDAATGKITGTISATAPGVYSVSVTAQDDKGAATIESFAWTVNDTPPKANGTIAGPSYPDSTAGISIATARGFTSPNGVPLTYRATGLPSGLSIDPATGIITGQLDHDASATAPQKMGSGAMLDGTYTVNVTADDGQGGTVVQTFTIDATNSAPTIVANTPGQRGQDGQAVSLDARQAFSDANTGDVLTYSAANLPQGLSIDPATGLISGTIANTASKAGAYAVQVTATDDKGAATTETFQWVVDDLAPQATPPLADRSINDGMTVSYATSGGFTNPNNVALAYSATGLPSGLSIDPTTGLISGTLNHDASAAVSGGLYTVAVTVDDGQGGTATNIFHLTASNQAPVVATPIADRSNSDGDSVKPIDASKAFTDPNPGDTLTYAASNLPEGLAIDPNTGLISGTIAGDAAPGAYYVTVTATDDKGAATPATFNWSVGDVPPTATGTLPGQRFTDGQAGIALATSGGFTSPNGLPLTYAATGLPRGLSIDPDTGAITGFISHNASLNAPKTTGAGATLDGTYTVTITASDGQGGTAVQSFTVDSTNQAPILGLGTADQNAADGQKVSIDVSKSFADPNTGDTLRFGESGLPAGLAIDPATGLITGTVDPRASGTSPYSVTVTATDNKGAATSETFAFAVTEVPPTAGTAIAASLAPDGTAITPIDTASHFASPNGLPLSYTAAGLPAGLSIDPTSGQITGTLDHDASKNAPTTSGAGATLDGTYTVTISASDGQGGVATQTFTFDATNQAPAIAAQTPDQHGTDGQAVSLDTANAFADPNTGDVVTYAAGGLPAGLSIDPTTGRITGMIAATASAQGPYAVTVTATDDKGAATTESFAWAIADAAPVAGTLPDRAANDGAAVSIATAGGFGNPNGLTLSYSATGLPAGLAIDPTTGVISGTLDHDASIGNGGGAGTYTISVTADDGQGGRATDVLQLTASNQAPVVGSKIFDQSNADGATIVPVDVSKAFADPNGDPLTYAASNLPAGLSIDPRTGLVSGTVAGSATPGAYGVSVTATDDKGAAATEAFTWNVTDVPPTAKGTLANQMAGDGAAAIAIDTAPAFADANGNALTYAATGLPAGLSIDPTSGRITGTLDHDASANAPVTSGSGATLDGTYTVTVTASDGLGGSTTQTFTFDARNGTPVVGTKTADRTNTEGDAVSVDAASAFSDPNAGDVLTYAAVNLPAGLAIDAKTGLITGTVAGGDNAGSPYAVAVTATDDKGAATSETLSWTILPTRPSATSPLPNVSGFDGTAVAIDTASHFGTDGAATTYAATGLVAGLSIDPASGRITGTLDHDASKNAPTTTGSGATLDGTYVVTVTATNAGGSTAQRFDLDAGNQAPVVGAKTADQSNADGATITPVDASRAFADPNGDPLTYGASGLPAGLSIDPATGRITGTVAGNAKPGSYIVVVTATDDKGAATTESFAWTISDVPPTTQGTLPAQGLADGQGGVAIATASGFADANGNPLTYAATGLPKGLSIDPATGRITGTLDRGASTGGVNGTYTVTVTASDGLGGTATQTLTIVAGNQAPVVGANTADQGNADGATITPVEASQAFADPNGDPLTYAASGLPAGLSIDPATGRITGTVAGNAKPGSYQVAVTATDDKGAATTESFAWTISDVPPTTRDTLPAQGLADGQGGVAITTANGFADANGNPLTYAATGLPKGLSIDPASGRITGTLDRGASTGGDHGTYTVTVTVSDGLGGTASQTLTIAAGNQAPVVGANIADQVNADGATITPVDASRAFADPNGDPLTYAASGLPAGLSIDPATGRITGTVAGNAKLGSYTVVVTATDDKGAATTESFAWTISDVPPTAGSSVDVGAVPDGTTIAPLDTSASFGSLNGVPLTYAASGLPAGLVIDPATGIVTGTLDHDASTGGDHGTYTVTITASDGQGGTATQTYTLEATNQAPALVAPTPDQVAAQGQAVAPVDASQAFADPNAGDVVAYVASGLPKGLTIDPATGLVSGTIAPEATPSDYVVTVTATDDKGAATSETFHWSVGEVPPVADGSLPSQRYGDGQSGIAISTSGGFASPDGLPLAYDASGLPAGLSIDPATGLITGTLDRNASALAPVRLGAGSSLEGIYAVTITATDSFGGTTTQVFAIEVDNVPPAIGTRTPDQHGRAGQSIGTLDTGAAFVDTTGDALTFAATGLPPGLAFDPATGRVTGVVDPTLASSGVYTVTVTATDEKGASVTESFLYTVDAVAPSILTPPSFFEPATALLPNLLVATYARLGDSGPIRPVEPATPILDVISQTSGGSERSQVIALDGIVVSTVNGIAPLNGLQRLSEPGEGIVRSGAGTNEIGDRIARAESGVGRGVEALSTPLNFLGATSIDVDASARGETGPTINIETMLRDRVLSISVGSGAGPGDPLARVTVTLADGRPLPAWLRADGKGYLVGKVPGGVESIDLAITSTFASGATSHRSVTIRTDRGTITPLVARPQARTLSHMVADSRPAPADLSRIARLI